jgi:hypothetical protein
MTETAQLGLPLVQPAQAQKHVTVNEAFARLDGLTHLTLVSTSVTTPPGGVTDGVSYGVPTGGVNEWFGHDGEIAIWSNGGWVFVAPQIGWRAWIADQGKTAIHSGSEWVASAMAVSPSGAASVFDVVEFDHVFGAEAVSTTTVQIPKYAMVHAVTGRVKTAITGTLTSFDLGVTLSTNRYGGGLGLAAGSWLVGITGQPVTYYAAEPLVITANGGDFAGGELRLALHYYLPTPPAV